MLAINLYEDIFEIRDNGPDRSPITFCTNNPSTMWAAGDMQDTVISLLIEMKVPETTQMSLMALLELPRHVLVSIVREIRQLNAKRDAQLAALDEERKRLEASEDGRGKKKKRNRP